MKVRVVGSTEKDLTFITQASSDKGHGWNVFRSATFNGVTLTRGRHDVIISFPRLDEHGMEIDYVDISMVDDSIVHHIISCQRMCGEEL